MLYLHENLRRYRTERGLTQEETAQVFGVSAQAVSRWETGNSCPDVELLPAIANYYGVTLDALVGIHGDMFPTNILVYQGSCNFVDWANAGISPYMMDIGRLTSIINKDTLLPMCPCSEKVIHAYYEKMRPLLEMEYDAYLKDVYMSQFLELAYFYSPLVFGRPKDKYSLKIEQRLHEIVECHFK